MCFFLTDAYLALFQVVLLPRVLVLSGVQIGKFLPSAAGPKRHTSPLHRRQGVVRSCYLSLSEWRGEERRDCEVFDCEE